MNSCDVECDESSNETNCVEIEHYLHEDEKFGENSSEYTEVVVITHEACAESFDITIVMCSECESKFGVKRVPGGLINACNHCKLDFIDAPCEAAY